MAYVFKDLDGYTYELTNDMTAEELIDIVTNEVTGYKLESEISTYKISKETYEAIVKKRKGTGPDLVKIPLR